VEVFYIKRVLSNANGTLGVLYSQHSALCVTLEDPWRDNQRNISCIPTGTYTVVPHSGTRYKNVWRLEDVPNRSAILIHQGNTTKDTEGCILVGTSFVPDEMAINESRKALQNLRLMLPQRFVLSIS
jgi:hypothetical protein